MLKVRTGSPTGRTFSRNNEKPYKFNKTLFFYRGGLLLIYSASCKFDKMRKKNSRLLFATEAFFEAIYFILIILSSCNSQRANKAYNLCFFDDFQKIEVN